MNNISVGAMRFAIVFSAAYRVVELIFKDEYTLVNFFVNITMDMAKIAVGIQISTVVVGGLITVGLIVGGSVILVSLGVFLLGLGIAYLLSELDEKFKISETIIKDLKFHRRAKAETRSPQPIFNTWKAISRG